MDMSELVSRTKESSPPIDRIVLHYTPAWWMAEFFGSVARQVRAIAGVDMVPTGFNGCVPGTVVRQAIELLNPNTEVKLAEPADVMRADPSKVTAAPEKSSIPATPPVAAAIAAAAVASSLENRRAQTTPSTASTAAAKSNAALALASEVIGKCLGARATASDQDSAENEHKTRTMLDRAMKIREELGMLVACSYLREKGWSFEAAHRALLATGRNS